MIELVLHFKEHLHLVQVVKAKASHLVAAVTSRLNASTTLSRSPPVLSLVSLLSSSMRTPTYLFTALITRSSIALALVQKAMRMLWAAVLPRGGGATLGAAERGAGLRWRSVVTNALEALGTKAMRLLRRSAVASSAPQA
eukprot:CAMPEP_0171102538 /NCGR_PEP_ID=MMETSP0766_2-20121228/58079_1 /TAXON_ID=439317 /ORGANISM="Gambierdiscus australes, Strain CAWD 149" /LENGTH=139 /DNA_ID=CAMNT_0011562855 /DNA_START=165 /DNA_END=585 /DNA_ORIENTATION=+